MAPDFDARLLHGIENPESNEAKKLAHLLAPFVMITGSRVPFSHLERGTRAVTELVSMIRFMGLPSYYVTVAPDDRGTAIIARMIFRRDLGTNDEAASAAQFWKHAVPHSNSTTPSEQWESFADVAMRPSVDVAEDVLTWRVEVGKAIMEDPTAVALVCKRMMQAMHEELFQAPRLGKKSVADFSSREPGVAGRTQGVFNVSEVTGRCASVESLCDELSYLSQMVFFLRAG